jgi:hypothetical protein
MRMPFSTASSPRFQGAFLELRQSLLTPIAQSLQDSFAFTPPFAELNSPLQHHTVPPPIVLQLYTTLS